MYYYYLGVLQVETEQPSLESLKEMEAQMWDKNYQNFHGEGWDFKKLLYNSLLKNQRNGTCSQRGPDYQNYILCNVLKRSASKAGYL